jgi:hypothetical protein
MVIVSRWRQGTVLIVEIVNCHAHLLQVVLALRPSGGFPRLLYRR